MRLTIIGSADAFNSEGRGHACYWLEDAAEAPVMVDFGGTALAGIKRLGLEPRRIGVVLLTHLHADHFAGLPYLHVDQTFRAQRSRPLVVVGPPGTRERLSGLLELTYGRMITEHAAFEMPVRELTAGQEMEIGTCLVKAFPAQHVDPPEEALCLRLTCADGTVLAFSGDTEPCDGLLEAADGADLLIGDCTAIEPPAGRHCTWTAWQDLLPRIRARRVLLSHLGEGVRTAVTGALERDVPGPPVDVADDGMAVEVMRGIPGL